MGELTDCEYDFFVSHASEDKEAVAAPLSMALEGLGLRVWFDTAQLIPGDRLRRRIDQGLRSTHCGVVILSPSFMQKEWPQRELDALFAKEEDGTRIVPVLHELSRKALRKHNPLLADYISLNTKDGIDTLAIKLADVAERAWSFNPLYRSGEYHTEIRFPIELLPPALEAVHDLLRPETWPRLRATQDVSRPRVWMASDDDRLISIGFNLFRPLLVYAQREKAMERSASEYGEVPRLVFELIRLSFDAWTREYDLAKRYGMPVVYTPRTRGWRQLREADPARYLLQGLNRDEIENALRALDALQNGLADVDLESFTTFYRRAFIERCVGYKEIGLLYNALYRFRPVDRPVFISLLALFHALWSMALNISSTGKIPVLLDEVFLQYLEEITTQIDSWPSEQNAAFGRPYRMALHRYVASQLPDQFSGPKVSGP